MKFRRVRNVRIARRSLERQVTSAQFSACGFDPSDEGGLGHEFRDQDPAQHLHGLDVTAGVHAANQTALGIIHSPRPDNLGVARHQIGEPGGGGGRTSTGSRSPGFRNCDDAGAVVAVSADASCARSQHNGRERQRGPGPVDQKFTFRLN